MSADLHLITFDPARLPIEVVREYRTFTYPGVGAPEGSFLAAQDRWEKISQQVNRWDEGEGPNITDDIWIGQLSHMKAGLDNDVRWLPRAVEHFERFYAHRGEVLQLTPEIASALLPAFNLKHDSYYETRARGHRKYRWSHLGVAKAREVKKFLQAHLGEYTFIDTW